MPPLGRRDYLKYSGAIAGVPFMNEYDARTRHSNQRHDRQRSGPPNSPVKLRIEYANGPLGVESQQPRLGWEFRGRGRGGAQTAYRVLVASSREQLSADVGDKWDSGKVESDSTHVEYAGKDLESGERLYWKVRVWNQQGASSWSDVSTWEMGLLDESDWAADWIGPQAETQQGKLGNLTNGSRGWTDYTIDVDFTLEEGNFGVVFRAMDSFNCYLAELVADQLGSPSTLRVRVREHGQWRTLSEAPVAHLIPPGTEHDTHNLSVRVSRDMYEKNSETNVSQFQVSVDGTVVSTVEDGTHLFGRVGFWTDDDAHAWVDNLDVNNLQGETLYADDFGSDETAINYAAGEFVGGKLHLDGTGVTLLHKFHPYVIPAPLLRREETFTKPVAEARAYVSGLGFYELYINGERVGNQVLDPGRTDYEGTVLYATHDVTDFLNRGENSIGVALGRARFGEAVPNVKNWQKAPWWSDPQLRLQIEVKFTDGSTRLVTSDDSWRVGDGPTRYDSLFTGEIYDARCERDGWTEPGYDDTNWTPARTVEPPSGDLTAELAQSTKVVDEIQPVEMTEPRPGVYVYDVGQQIAGWTELTISGESGADVRISMGEDVGDDGLINNTSPRYVSAPLQEDTYVLGGDGEETWEPRFTYKGFRYIQIEGKGVPEDPGLNTVTAKVVHQALEEGVDSDFTCSNDLLSQIHENTRWAMLNNLHSGVHTDSPTYEKDGWNETQIEMGQSMAYNFSMPRFYKKRLRDVRDAQLDAPDEGGEEGQLPVMLPTPGYGYYGVPDPGWQSSYPILAWTTYQYYGDEQVLEDHYEGIKSYLAYLQRYEDDHIIRTGLGDWVAPTAGSTPADEGAGLDGDVCAVDTMLLDDACLRDGVYFPPEGPALTSTAYYYKSVKIAAKAASLLDNMDEAEAFHSLAEDIKQAFNEEFFYPEQGVYHSKGTGPGGFADLAHSSFTGTQVDNPAPYPGYRQTSNVFPLAYGLVPEGHEEAVLDNLVFDIMERHDGHLNTGSHGTHHLLQVLSEYGRHDVAYTVATQRTYPSWGWWIVNGATALYERWKLDPRSRDHDFLGSIDEWFYQYVAGIREPAEPGFKQVEVAPLVVDDMEWAEGRTDTVQGVIESRWEQSTGGLYLEVTVPGTASGTVRIPDLGADAVMLRESGQVIWANGEARGPLPAGIESVEREKDAVVVSVGAGSYEFDLETSELHVIGSRSDDGTVFTGGQTDQIDLSVTATEAVRVRDQIPAEWTIQAGDAHTVYEEDGTHYVEFDAQGQDVDVTYFVEAPSGTEQTGQYTFGPIEVTTGGSWEALSGTRKTNLVVGADTNL